MAYDFEAMKKDGFTDSDISSAIGFDYAQMKKDGYTDEDISGAIDSGNASMNAEATVTAQENDLGMITVKADTVEISPDTKYLNSLANEYEANRGLLEAKKQSISNSTGYTDEEKNVLLLNVDKSIAELKTSRIEKENKYIQANKPVPKQSEDKKDTNIFDDIKSYSDSLREGIQAVETEIGRLASPTLKLALHTAEKIGNSIGQTAENVVNPIANVFGIDFDFYEKNGKAIREEGIRLNNSIDPNNKAMLSPTKTFDVITSMAVPLRIKNNFDLAMTEGLLGYALEYGNTGNISEAINTGIYSAGISSAVTGIFDEIGSTLARTGTSKPLEYLWDKHSLELIEASGLGKDATKKQVIDAIEQDWLKVMQGNSSNETKIRAMIDRLGQTGATYKGAVEEVSDNASGVVVRSPKSSRVEDIRGNVSDSTQEVSDALAKEVGYSKQQSKELAKGLSDNPEEVIKIQEKLRKGDISELYGDFITSAKSKYNGKYNVDNESMSSMKNSLDSKVSKNGALSSAETNLANALDGELTMDKLITIKKESTDIAMNSKDNVLKFNASKLKNEAEKILKDTMSTEDFKLFKTMDDEYTNRSAITSKKDVNKIGVELMKLANGKQTLPNTIATLNKIKVGNIDMKAIEKVIGSDNVAKLEKSIINNMLSGKVDDVSWGVVSKSLDSIGLVSKEGKQLKESIDYMNKVFSADNYSLLNVLRIPKESDSAALTADILQKVKYATASGIWQQIKRRFYITKEYEDIRAVRDIAEILTSKNVKTRGLNIDREESYDIVRDSMKQAYRTQIEDMRVNVSEEQIDDAVNKDMSKLGFDSAYGGKATKPTDRGIDTNVNVQDKLIPTAKKEPTDKQGGLKITEVTRTTKGTKATASEKEYLNRFMDDIANPEYSIKNESFNKIYDMVKKDKDIMYGQSEDKKKVFNELFGALSQAKQQGSVKPALRRYIQERLVKYHDMINKGK